MQHWRMRLTMCYLVLFLGFCCVTVLADAPSNSTPSTPVFPDLPDEYVCQTSDARNEHIIIGCGVALIIIGLVMVLYGYKTIRGIAFAVGFCVLFIVAWIIIDRYIAPTWPETYKLGASAGVGVLAGGLLAYFVSELPFIFGFCIGILVTSLIFSTPLGPQSFTPGNWLPLLSLALGGIVGGILGFLLRRFIMMFVSAAFGSFIIAYAIDCAFFKSSFTTVIPNIIALKKFNFTGNLVPYILVGGVILFTLVGCIFQWHMRSREKARNRTQYSELK